MNSAKTSDSYPPCSKCGAARTLVDAGCGTADEPRCAACHRPTRTIHPDHAVRTADELMMASQRLLRHVIALRDEIARLRIENAKLDCPAADAVHDDGMLERAAAAVERLDNHESLELTHIGESHHFTRAIAIKEAAAAIRALKPKEETSCTTKR